VRVEGGCEPVCHIGDRAQLRGCVHVELDAIERGPGRALDVDIDVNRTVGRADQGRRAERRATQLQRSSLRDLDPDHRAVGCRTRGRR